MNKKLDPPEFFLKVIWMMVGVMGIILVAVAVAVLLNGCDIYDEARYTVRIESNSAWHGVFGDEVIKGQGNAAFDMRGEGCAMIWLDDNQSFIAGYGRWVQVRVSVQASGYDESFQGEWARIDAAQIEQPAISCGHHE